MGTSHYDGATPECVDDADLALLQAVVHLMLEHSKPFLVTFSHDHDGENSVWISSGVPLRFDFDDPAACASVDDWHVDLMTAYAGSEEGVTIRVRQAA